ncbi:EAL domain-containing protein [Paracoccus liaowanqingii]|uniref:EAL domain-containing protein n=1 Tax=Paracoccus liaowanqingii TaxID=2560053 RepID=A0A4Z1C1Q0_9RHOB|nr:EAL domain-containing protein [Paracoccus liaowanqingii]TGN56557.1 EAL domain-containing protein [Paracoccus liaowanqingii]
MSDMPRSRQTISKFQIIAVFALALGGAVALACLVGTGTFPLLAGIPARSVVAAVAATAFLVALPIVFMLTFLIARFAGRQRNLAAREELFVTAQQIGKFGYWHYDVKTSKFTLSDNVHDLLGDPNCTLQMDLPRLLEMTDPDDRDMLSQALHRIVVEGSREEIEYRLTGLDGVQKTFWVDGKRMLDRAGNPLRAYGACRDITDQKKIEAALRESEAHYRYAVELNAQIPWTADAEGNVEELGPRWFWYTGMKREDALGTGWASALHPEDLELNLPLWSEALRSGEPIDVEYRLRQTGGSWRWFRARAAPRRNDQGSIVRWYGTLEDIHDRKMANVALRESEAFARSILESTPDCVRVVDLDGHVQFMNGPGMREMKIDDFESRLKGQVWASLWPADARETIECAVDAARQGRTAHFSHFCPTAKGTAKWWNVSVSPIFGPNGEPDKLLVISRDMTTAKRTQDALERAKRAAEQSAQRLENVLSSTTDGVITFDRQLRVVYLNRSALEVVPGARGLIGKLYHEAVPELVSPPFEEYFHRAFSQGVPEHFEGYFAAYDRWLKVHVYPSPDGISLFFKDVSERQRAQEQLLYLAHHDTLTGLANRAILYDVLEKSLVTALPEKPTVLLFLDLDEFKAVNDTLGHCAGDRLLVEVSGRLKSCVRTSDVVARFGGDEFAVVADVDSPDEAARLAERIIDVLQEPYELDGRPGAVGVSIGIVSTSDPNVTAGEVLRDADIALYQAKANGRGTYRIFETAMGQSFREREALKQDLRGAVARGELHLVYQPLLDLATNRVNGFEALLRWHHPTRGLVPPVFFIPVAEEMGLIVEIGAWALDRACHDAATWPEGITVAVNLSSVQFRTGNVLQTVAHSLLQSGLSGKRLQLEITESVLLADSAANLELLHALRTLGITISMDDFGTGYSSLSYLRSYPFDKIKIDRSFVSDLSMNEASAGPKAIVRAIIGLAQSLGMTITAEGVETASQISVLRSMGCNEVQGFLISKPVGAEGVAETISRLNNASVL